MMKYNREDAERNTPRYGSGLAHAEFSTTGDDSNTPE